LAFVISPAFAAKNLWHRAKAANTIDGGTLGGENAEVSGHEARFNATLFWKSSDQDVQIVFKGTRRNGKITAEETIPRL
jgi:hypothetical protein